MRRDDYLKPLSSAHHQTLRLARDLQRCEVVPRLQRRLWAETDALAHHFAEEERSFVGLIDGLPQNHPVEALLDRMHREHRALSALLDILTAHTRVVDASRYLGACQSLGRLLAEHIAFEERRLFPALQDCCLGSQFVHPHRGQA